MTRRLHWIFAALLATEACTGVKPRPETASTRIAHDIERLLAVPPPAAGERSRLRAGWLRQFYQSRDYAPAWLGPHGAMARAHELADAVAGAAEHGLRADVYGASQLRAALSRTARQPAAVDVAFTAAFLAYADDLMRGAIDPASTTQSWKVQRPANDLSGLLATSIDLNEVVATLRRLTPTRLEYGRLQRALAAARARPEAGDLVDRLRANLERWRWLPRDLGSRYLLVRIADFELDLVEDGVVTTHRVIVGEPFRQTPQFASPITHLVVHPSWYVPQSIAAEEMLPGLRSPDLDLAPDMEVWTLGPEPHQVAREAVVWEDSTALTHYRFVQRPGPANPLGRVKFVLDNPFAVYLHDTPGTGLFERDERDLSHGCIRVEDAVSLARRLLRHDRSQQTRFDVLLQAGDTGRVELAEPLSTYVMYWTVSVTPGGDTRYLRDLYEVDSRLVAALDRVEGANPWLWPLTGKPTFETGLTP